MKELHLICNAHIDPVWMWDWEEGIATTLSTFYSAVELSGEYDYIFCHNEVLVYEYIEKYAPVTFEKIKKLVADGKWHIAGGWYLQPDCNMPSGEAFLRQILLGKEYFLEKFGVEPTTALNYDSFGHSVGLVQIMAKTGYDSYLIGRPALKDKFFSWQGLDGSAVKTFLFSGYTTKMGEAKEGIKQKAEWQKDLTKGAALWGVGNHGGGPSRKDLREINAWIAEGDEQRGYKVLHSTPERFFEGYEPQAVNDQSLVHCCIKTYSSINAIKQKHIELEHQIFSTEKIIALAALHGNPVRFERQLKEAQKELCELEFHDILSGTCTKEGEKSSLQKADHAIVALKEAFAQSYFYLTEKFREAKEGEFPVFVFNPHPYPLKTNIEVEFLIPDPLCSECECYEVTVKHGEETVTSQIIKEDSNIAYDRRKRVAFVYELQPFNIERFELYVSVKTIEPIDPFVPDEIVVEDEYKTVKIDGKTGLLSSYVVDGKEYVAGKAFLPVMYDDNVDTWGWKIDEVGTNPRPFRPSKCEKGEFKRLSNVLITENGDVMTRVESLFERGSSFVRVSYKIYKGLPYMDVDVDVSWNEKKKALKIEIPTVTSGEFLGQIPFGTEYYERNGHEQCIHRFTGVKDESDDCFAVFNNCVYGTSCKDNVIRLTLLNGSCYCAHPIHDAPIIDETRYNEFIETGKHRFSFRVAVKKVCELESASLAFVEKPYALNHFPHGTEEIVLQETLRVSDPSIALWALREKQETGETFFRLMNNSATEKQTELLFKGSVYPLRFGKYEVKTIKYKDGKIEDLKKFTY